MIRHCENVNLAWMPPGGTTPWYYENGVNTEIACDRAVNWVNPWDTSQRIPYPNGCADGYQSGTYEHCWPAYNQFTSFSTTSGFTPSEWLANMVDYGTRFGAFH